ncbi:Pet127-domain-containing protein [Xylaria sp. FL0043]|nr:Pet127-domain-containing protein [Xylaria sp. FL0043]
MEFLRCCFVRRKPPPTSPSTLPNVPNFSPGTSGEDFKTLTDLRQKCEENTLSTAEARALLDASGKVSAPLTPREIEELHRILSPPPPAAKPGTTASTPGSERTPRTPTNHMLPESQAQSDLFCLPAEVRTQIWRYAVGGRKIYLAVKNGKLVQQENLERPYWRPVRGLLSVPLICRKSYLESINLLYSDNTFGFGIGPVGSSKDFFTQADALLLPQCIAAMTSLEVGFHLSGGYSQYHDSHPQAWDISLHIGPPEPLSSWICVFKALAQMKQLRSLVVVVWASGDRRHEFRAREPELMDIPSGMTGLKRFDVWLPWKEKKDGPLSQYANMKSKPYIVRRSFEDRPSIIKIFLFAMLRLGRRGLCRFTSPHVCPSCLATSPPTSIILRQRIAASHHVRTLSTTLTRREATTPDAETDTSSPATDIAAKAPRKRKKKKPAPETDTQRQLKVLEGALTALKNVLAEQGVNVSQIPTTESTAEAKSESKPKPRSKSKSKGGKTGDKVSRAATSRNTSGGKDKNTTSESQTSTSGATAETAQPDGAATPPASASKAARPRSTVKRKRAPVNTKPWRKSASLPKPADLGVPFGLPDKLPDKVHPRGLSLFPIETSQPDVPSLSYGLERVLFNPGVYQLQDPRSRVYNFDPYLSEIMPIAEFDFNALKQYVTSSKDPTLISIAKQHEKKYSGSTSSMTSMLAHFHYLLSAWRNINVSMLSRSIDPESVMFTRIMKAPAAIFLHWKDGTYAIDADKEFDSANILSMLGKSMEKLLTLSKDEYERYRRGNSDQITEEERNAEEAFHYTGFQDFMMRSQLDAYDPRVPGTGMFDLKTRAVISIRMDAKGYEKGLGYEIRQRFGQWASFEREYYDMIRSAFLKYSLQVRMGRMDGIFVAFHNTQRIFGFQYISLNEMDLALHGTDNRHLGDQEFKISLKLLNELLDRATKKWPEQSLRLHFETKQSTGPSFMYFFAKPTSPKEIEAVQSAGRASVEAFEKSILGLTDYAAEEVADETKVDDINEDTSDQKPSSPAQDIDSFAAWQEARQMVEEAIEDDELGVGPVREAIADALEQSGILRARSLTESREYVDALLGALIGRAPPAQGDVVDDDELEEQNTGEMQESDKSRSPSSPETETEREASNAPLGQEQDVEEGFVGQRSSHMDTKDVRSAVEENDGHADSPHIESSQTDLGGSPRLDQSTSNTHETQSRDSQTTSTQEMSEPQITSQEHIDTTKPDPEEEFEEEEEDDYEETSKEFREDASSSSFEPLKSLIMRMARRIDEQPVPTSTDSPQDDASKLKEFERILGQLISQSRMDQSEEDVGDDLSGRGVASETAAPDAALADMPGSNEAASTPDIQEEETPLAAAAEKSESESQPSNSDLLALTLTIKNKVNGAYVRRPSKLSKRDDWTVEYEIEEIEPRQRRRKVLSTAEDDKEAEWHRMFGGNLPKHTQRGRKFREAEMKQTEGQPVWTVDNKGPLEWQDVFRRQPKISETSDEGPQ